MHDFDLFRLNLEAAIEASGLSQGAFASIAGCSRVYVNRVISGKTIPSISRASELAAAVGKPLKVMFSDHREFKKELQRPQIVAAG